jgi:hypothetical protein
LAPEQPKLTPVHKMVEQKQQIILRLDQLANIQCFLDFLLTFVDYFKKLFLFWRSPVLRHNL